MDGVERRRHARVRLSVSGVIQFLKQPEVDTLITEVSEGGLRCIFPEPVSLGASAELRFSLPVATGKPCIVVGRVQHYYHHHDSFQLGIEFTRVSAEVVKTIREYVRQTLDAHETRE